MAILKGFPDTTDFSLDTPDRQTPDSPHFTTGYSGDPEFATVIPDFPAASQVNIEKSVPGDSDLGLG